MKYKIKYKLALYTTAVSLFCFLFSVFYFYIVSNNIFRNYISKISFNQLKSISENIDFVLKNINNEAELLVGNEYVQQLLDSEDSLVSGDREKVLLKIDESTNDMIMKEQGKIDFISILSHTEGVKYELNIISDFIVRLGFGSIKKEMEGRDSIWLSGTNKNISMGNTPVSYRDRIMFIKRINSTVGKKDLGFIIILFRNRLVGDYVKGEDLNLCIMNKDDIIYRQGELFADNNNFNAMLPDDEGTITWKYDKNEYLVSTLTAEYCGLRLVSYQNVSKILDVSRNISRVMLLSGLIFFIISLSFSFFIAFKITAPINKIEEAIVEIREGKINPDNYKGISKVLFSNAIINKKSIILICIALIATPVIISIGAIFYETSGSVSKFFISCYQEKNNLVGYKLDAFIKNYNDATRNLFGDKKLNEKLLGANFYEDQKAGVEEYLNDILYNNGYIASGELTLTIFNAKKEAVFHTGLSQNQIEGQLYNFNQNKDDDYTVWLPANYYFGTYLLNFGKEIVSFSNYKDIYFFDRIGYMVFTLSEQLIERIYNQSFDDTQGTSYIINSDSLVISHPDKSFIGKKAALEYTNSIFYNNKKSGDFILIKDKTDYVVSFCKLNENNWIVISEIPLQSLTKDINKVKNLTIVLVIANIIAAMFLVLLYFNSLKRKILKINEAMNKVAGGDITVKLSINSGDEIQKLAEGFNAMVIKLKELMEENYNQGLRRKEAELNALQAQINPHFLYNTLESINWSAMMMTGGPNKVSRMVTALSDLLRLSINKGKEIVTLRDEINHVKNYLIIQKVRYSDKFDVEWSIDPQLDEYKTLKLILQPLVENAIYHGLELKPGKGLIVIKGQLLENCIKLEIIDDGIGMSPEQLQTVRTLLEGNDKNENIRSIGINNVNERIQLYFGKEYGIKIFSEEKVGTRIEIYLPLVVDEVVREKQ